MKISSLLLAASLAFVACDSSEPAKPAPAKDDAADKADAKADAKTDAKPDDKPADAKPADAKPADAKPAGDEDAAAAPAGGDSLEIVVSHAEPKPDDPAVVTFAMKVTAAKFDPKNPAGGTATIEIDAGSVNSKNEMRDGHLKTPDYLDAAGSPTILVEVSDVKAAGEAWSAQAKVTARGTSATWPLNFEILETTDTSIRIKGTHSFDRTTVGIGKSSADGDSAANTVEARFSLTLSPTG